MSVASTVEDVEKESSWKSQCRKRKWFEVSWEKCRVYLICSGYFGLVHWAHIAYEVL
jgi:hypothetical protein